MGARAGEAEGPTEAESRIEARPKPGPSVPGEEGLPGPPQGPEGTELSSSNSIDVRFVRVLTLALVTSAAIAAPSRAAPARLSPEGTRFVAAETAKVRVSFSQPVHFEDLKINVDGRGRVYGFILSKVGQYDQEGFRPVIQDVVMGQCARPACKGRAPFHFPVAWNVGGEPLTGEWDLYVIADGAPVTVSFDKRSAITRRVPLTDTVDDEVVTLEPRVDLSGDRRVMSAGSFTSLASVDFALLGLWGVGDPGHNTAYGDCFYDRGVTFLPNDDGVPNQPAETAFLPGCPTADGDAEVRESSQQHPSGVAFTVTHLSDKAGVGGWYATTAELEHSGAIAYWIDL